MAHDTAGPAVPPNPPRPRARRTVFGEAAERYDAARPSYPAELVGDVLDFAALETSDAVLEVGAGTGKAAVAFASRVPFLTCVEPDERMAGVLARNLRGRSNTAVAQGEFETWDGAEHGRYGLLYSAQAWHWIDPEVRWERARSALRTGGALALFWNDWTVVGEELRAELRAAHEGIELGPAPHTVADTDPEETVRGRESWVWRELTAFRGFGALAHRRYRTRHARTTTTLIDLLASVSSYRLLPDTTRRALLAEVARIVDARGGAVELDTVTGLFLARAV